MFGFCSQCKTYKVKNDRAGSFFPFTFTDITGIHNVGIGIKTDDIIQLLNDCIKDGYIVSAFNTNFRFLIQALYHKVLLHSLEVNLS